MSDQNNKSKTEELEHALRGDDLLKEVMEERVKGKKREVNQGKG